MLAVLAARIGVSFAGAAAGKAAEERLDLILQNGKSGFMNGGGKVVIEPRFTTGGGFHSGRARIQVGER